jgi:hypothetical protein
MVWTTRSGRDIPEWNESNYGRAANVPDANGNRRQHKRTKNRRITRAAESKQARLVIQTSSSNDLPVDLLVRLTRSQLIRCTHYGPDRETVFPSHYFYGPCREWDLLINTVTVARNKQNSRRNECCAYHTTPTQPTQQD